MKTVVTFIFLLFFSGANSQDTTKIVQINARVAAINQSSSYLIKRDTVIQDQPEMGFKLTTYLSSFVNGGELIKYVNLVKASIKEYSGEMQLTTSSIFYYYQNKLIKVEEFMIENDKKNTAEWYYLEDQPLYYTVQSAKAKERAVVLLSMSKEILQQIIKQ